MQEKPKLAIPKTRAERIANIVGYIIFVGTLIYVIIIFFSLPSEVPGHFGVKGEVSRYGSKYEMIILIFVSLILVSLLELIEHFPEMHNYPKRMNQSNIKEFYLNSRELINLIKNGIMIVFSIILIEIISYGLTYTPIFGVYLTPLIILFIFGPIVWKMIERRKIK